MIPGQRTSRISIFSAPKAAIRAKPSGWSIALIYPGRKGQTPNSVKRLKDV